MKSLWLKIWSWYTGNTYVRHFVTTVIAAIIVHYASFLTSWAPASDQAFWNVLWTAAGSPLVRLAIAWAEVQLSAPTTAAPAAQG